MAALIVFTTLPDQDKAVKVAEVVLNAQLAACVHILPAGYSLYRWLGKIERSQEATLLIKTTDQAYPALENTIRKNHPYDLPEILAVPASGGLPEYLSWITQETRDSR